MVIEISGIPKTTEIRMIENQYVLPCPCLPSQMAQTSFLLRHGIFDGRADQFLGPDLQSLAL
jgi:hypothetical protein